MNDLDPEFLEDVLDPKGKHVIYHIQNGDHGALSCAILTKLPGSMDPEPIWLDVEPGALDPLPTITMNDA